MALSRRLRYEILRRDNHRCRYCGATALTATLTVDHVIPVALGGPDDPANLVTACVDCNAGKSSMPIDAPLVADVSASVLAWQEALRRARQDHVTQEAFRNDLIATVDEAWIGWQIDGRAVPQPSDWRESLRHLSDAGLGGAEARDFVAIAMRAPNVSAGNVWRYFCGICWRHLDGLHKRAVAHHQAILDERST